MILECMTEVATLYFATSCTSVTLKKLFSLLKDMYLNMQLVINQKLFFSPQNQTKISHRTCVNIHHYEIFRKRKKEKCFIFLQKTAKSEEQEGSRFVSEDED